MTDRQQQILNLIVETYARTAEPVGSLGLATQFGVSPATIRAEMAALETTGYIRQPHTSAGRIPTDHGYREYVNQLSVKTHTDGPAGRAAGAIRRQVQDIGGTGEAIKAATKQIAQYTGHIGIATLPDQLYRYGFANLLRHPEFFPAEAAYEAAILFDSLDEWANEVMSEGVNRISVLIGSENPIGKNSGTSAIIARFASPFSENSYIGLVGPTRQDYPYVMGLVEHVSQVLEEALND